MFRVFKYLVRGITWGCTISSLVCAVGVALNGLRWLADAPRSYPEQVLAGMLVGIGWMLPSMIYKNEKLARPVQALIHMVSGFAVYFPVAFYMGWIYTEGGAAAILFDVFLCLMIAFIVWICFILYYRREAREINRKLQQSDK